MTLTERKQLEKAKQREDILDDAEKLFFSRGYDGVSMDEITNEVELNKATLYLYFKDKESLFFAVINRGIKMQERSSSSLKTSLRKYFWQ